MIGNLKKALFFNDDRSKNIRINTLLNIGLRGVSILSSFLIVSVALTCIDKSQYGVWLTLTSITSWLSFMDVGLGNGLRNKLAEAIAADNKTLANELVSTTYITFSGIMIVVFALFAISNAFFDWNQILKTDINSRTLVLLTYLLVFSFCIRLILALATTIAMAIHKVYVESLINCLINISTLAALYILPRINFASFATFSVSLSIIPIIVLLGFNVYLFRFTAYKYLTPKLTSFKKVHIQKLLNIGMQFFIIQLSGIFVFSTDNILITQFFSPTEVTSFNVAYKYFSIATLAFTIVLLPYWSSFTVTYFEKNFVWIRKALKKLLVLWIVQILGVVLLYLFSNKVYKFWVGDNINIPLSLSLCLGLYSIIYNWNNIFAYFINGVSKIKLQLYSSVFAGLINVPLAYLLIKYSNLGLASIVVSNIICLFVSSIWSPIQCFKLINNKATGIWAK